MSPILHALMTKLNWQLNELSLQLDKCQKQVQALNSQIAALQEHIDQATFRSATIHPELEINRLNFISKNLLQKEELAQSLNEQNTVETKLSLQVQRLKTELKMLEKYTQKIAEQQKEQQKTAQANALDEWVMQQRSER